MRSLINERGSLRALLYDRVVRKKPVLYLSVRFNFYLDKMCLFSTCSALDGEITNLCYSESLLITPPYKNIYKICFNFEKCTI